MLTRCFAQRSFVQCAAALATFAGAAPVLAIVTPAASVQESVFPSNPVKTQYSVSNTSSAASAGGKFDIALLAVTTTGSNPTTTNTGWEAESLNAGAWVQSMGEPTGDFSLPTWQQYTGLTYTQAFPSNPIKVNGYFLDYSVDSGTGNISFPSSPIFPSNPLLGGFFFDGSPGSTFFVAGPTDGTTSFAPGAVVTFSAPATITPEPASLSLLAISARTLLSRRRQRR
jgi:hypothetical protein